MRYVVALYEIDRLCSEVDDLRNIEAAHLASLPAQPREFLLDIAFLSGGDHFTTETYSIEAFDWMDAKRIAFQLSADSPYDNDRILCLERRAIDRTPGPTSLEAAPSHG